MRSLSAALSLCLSLSFLGSCTTVGPDYTGPEGIDPPDAWSRAVLRDLRGDTPLAEWWRGFKDPSLNALIERARESNPNLKIALARIGEARALRGIAASQGLPQASALSDYVRSRSSENLFQVPQDNPSNLYAAGFDAGWEIDLFGGIRRNVEAGDANIEARYEDYRDALVTLFAEVAINYIDYRTLQERISVAEKNIAAQKGSVDITKVRFDGGLVPRIDVTQAMTNLSLSEAAVPVLRADLAAVRNRLATLTGGYPASVDGILGRSRGIPVPRPGYSAGLPADLLRSRPDVRRSERELAAQTALIGVAVAELYPRLTLFGDFQLQSINSEDFLDSASRTYSFGPSFRWRLFSGGAVRNAIAAEESRTEAALAAYEAVVLGAVEEVETSMSLIANDRDRLASISQAVGTSRETVTMVKDNYAEGLVDFQRVLDAERTKFDTEDQEVFVRGKIAADYVVLYKALGGGAESEYVPETSYEKKFKSKRKQDEAESDPQPDGGSAAVEK